MKKVFRDKKASVNLSAARTKERFLLRQTRFQPVVNWLPNGFQPVVKSRLCSSIGFPRVSLVCDSGETFKQQTFGSLEGAWDACFLAEQFCWHSAQPDAAKLSCRAP